MPHRKKPGLDEQPLTASALRVIQYIEESPDKFLTMSQSRQNNGAVIELLNHGLIAFDTFFDGIEGYRLTSKYDPRTVDQIGKT